MPHQDFPYMTSGSSQGPINWYASLPARLKDLYKYKEEFPAQPPMLVVLADVVCDGFTGWTLENLFKKKSENWEEFKKEYGWQRENIFNKKIRITYKLLSGDEIEEATFWQDLVKHNKRRNDFVHKGIIPSQSEADESFKAVEDFIQHVIGKVDPESPQ